jgi:hypothetical protein
MSDRFAPEQPQPLDPGDLLAAEGAARPADSPLRPLRPIAKPVQWPPGTTGSFPKPPPAPVHLIIELGSSQATLLPDPGTPTRSPPPGRRGERLATRAANRAIARYVYDHGIDDRLTARELARRANGYAVHLGLRDADLLDSENSTFREIAWDVLDGLRAPEKPGWKAD